MIEVRLLAPGDEPLVTAFLARHADASMFLRSNLRAAGLVDTGRMREGTWAAAFEGGELVGVVAHWWNGVIGLQAPRALAELVHAVTTATRVRERAVLGLAGPLDQVIAARAGLDLTTCPALEDDAEGLYALDVDALRVPSSLASGALRCREARDEDLPTCGRWREAYYVETFGMPRDAELPQRALREVRDTHARGDAFVVESATGELLAYSAFNATLPDMVQIGGVFCPPERRGRGHARAVVAGSLLHARERGVRRAVLFTGDRNRAAQRAYEAIGFRRIGAYGLVLFGA